MIVKLIGMKILIFTLFFIIFNIYIFPSKFKKTTQFKKNIFSLPVLNNSFLKILEKNQGFSKRALKEAFSFLDKNSKNLKKEGLCLNKDNIRNRKKIRNKSCLIVVDYTKSKKTPRLIVVNPQTGETELFYTAHGKGSHDKKEIETGHVAKRFSNILGSNMTSLGFYLTDNIYNSQKSTFGPGPSNGLKMDGINCSNSNARMRYIVIHTADYVQPINGDSKKIGNSEGCITLPEHRKDIIWKCRDGALVYAYYNKKEIL